MTLLDALAALPAWGRVMVRGNWAELSVKQVTDVLGCSPGNVTSHIARDLGRLRAMLVIARAGSRSLLGRPEDQREAGGTGDG